MKKEEIIKTLHSCAVITQQENGINIERLFDREADAILELYNKSIQSLTEPTQEGVVSAEEVLKQHISFRQNISNGNFTCVGIPYIDALKAMHTYASQTRGEEQKEKMFDFVAWVDSNNYKRGRSGCQKPYSWYDQEDELIADTTDELYQEYLNRK